MLAFYGPKLENKTLSMAPHCGVPVCHLDDQDERASVKVSSDKST